ncbi:MAG TPA: class I SAM-dependent methyltransferase [Fluviicoccus sp.]|nr:class I SAM-dependent methyltransferase [Fluviicoccus sp.]
MSDPERFLALLTEAASLLQEPGYYLSDNLFTWGRNNSALDDKPFMNAWKSNIYNAADQAILWRRYILCTSAYHCVQLEGDFVECGSLFGTGIKTVIDYFGREEFAKTFWGYDTFDTNPVDGHGFDGQKAGLYEEILKRFDGYDNVKLVKGLLPQSLQGNSPEKIAFLHIDLNSAEYEVAVLKVLFDRLVPGGILILDDYEWSGLYRPQKLKEDDWFERREYRVIPLPTGQGMVIKR